MQTRIVTSDQIVTRAYSAPRYLYVMVSAEKSLFSYILDEAPSLKIFRSIDDSSKWKHFEISRFATKWVGNSPDAPK
jgi:hypothetical protein